MLNIPITVPLILVSLLLVPFSPAKWHETLQGKLTALPVCKISLFQRNDIFPTTSAKNSFWAVWIFFCAGATSSQPSSPSLSIKQYGFLKLPRLLLLSPTYTHRLSKILHPNRLPLYKLKISLFTTSIHLFPLVNLQGEWRVSSLYVTIIYLNSIEFPSKFKWIFSVYLK